MSTNINMETESGGQLSREFLKDNLQTLWVNGILVLDAEGKTVCEYSTNESLTDEITAYLQKDIIKMCIRDRLNEGAEKIYAELSKYYNCEFDDRGNIGKRYRRQDEIGTPFCITYDFESETDQAVTVRDRDTREQVRVPIAELKNYFEDKFRF